MRNKDHYQPDAENAHILNTALAIVQSVDYEVSARWVFYRLLQASLYNAKEDYKKWIAIASRARHAAWGGWEPDTLADETRQPIPRGGIFPTERSWIEAVGSAQCSLDRWYTQPAYVELWYEARAMTDQFRYYTDGITLRPMGGDPSIAYKYAAARALCEADTRYCKPIYVLYYGDLDPKGLEIAETVKADVEKWCDVDFTFRRVGLTPEQVARYHVPENFEHPGAYQWEALTDDAAREIIKSGTDDLIDPEALQLVEGREYNASQWLSDHIGKLAEEYEG